jgi:hypothetical protein
MGVIFEVRPGIALQIPDDVGGNPFTLDVAGFGDAQVSRSIITQLSLRRNENVQFVHSLQDLIYAYSFGERIGGITVAGIAFAGMCNGDTAKTGIEYVNDWYEKNRIGNAAGPLRILIGGAGGSGLFKGALTDLELDIVKPDFRLTNFGFQFRTLPQRRQR